MVDGGDDGDGRDGSTAGGEMVKIAEMEEIW